MPSNVEWLLAYTDLIVLPSEASANALAPWRFLMLRNSILAAEIGIERERKNEARACAHRYFYKRGKQEPSQSY